MNALVESVIFAASARSNLADTDIPTEAGKYAEATLRVNVAVAVIAQARNLQASLVGALNFSSK